MTVTLPKGGNLLLADEAPGIERVRVGLGWGQGPGSGAIELDGLISLLGDASPKGRLALIHQVPNPDESVGAHPPSGPAVGDAEKLVVTLSAVPREVSRLQFGVTIYDAVNRRQTFRSVRGAYIRILNDDNGIEIARYTLEQETGAEIAMVFGELYRNARGWKFRAVGQGYSEGLRGVSGVTTGEPPIARPVEVNTYLRRGSPARSRRSLAEHLHPPKPVTPPPAPPAKVLPPQAAPQQAAPQRPARQQPVPPVASPQPAQGVAPPKPSAAPRTSLQHPARTSTPPPGPVQPPRPPAKRAPARSSLDLGGPDEPAADATVATPAPAHRTPVVAVGEHSSRYRQRMERVAGLDDDHPATTWTPEERGSGAMTVTLRWEPLQTSSGLPRPSDLQLGSFWQAGDRSSGVIQTIGNAISAPGASGPRQVLRLGRRDEREGQTIFVDLAALPTFRRFFVFAYGLHGSPEWALQRPELVVVAPSGEQLTMRLGEAPTSARLCLIASFHVVAGDLIIRRENEYFDGLQSEAAVRYGWNLEWNPDGMTLRG